MRSSKRVTIWVTDDRQGRKWFTARPTFVAMHDFFQGPQAQRLPKRVRLIRNFRASVTGAEKWNGYPSHIQVKTSK